MIVHPECRWEVCQKADALGSTERLIALVEQAPAGSMFAIGTEIHLVNRLARRFAPEGKKIITLDDTGCLCTTMYRITPAAPGVGAGESGGRPRGESHPGAAEREAVGEGGAGPDAGSGVKAGNRESRHSLPASRCIDGSSSSSDRDECFYRDSRITTGKAVQLITDR